MQLEREHNERAWLAYHTAAITRAKHMPRLERLLAKPSRKPTLKQLRHSAKAIARAFGGRVKGE